MLSKLKHQSIYSYIMNKPNSDHIEYKTLKEKIHLGGIASIEFFSFQSTTILVTRYSASSHFKDFNNKIYPILTPKRNFRPFISIPLASFQIFKCILGECLKYTYGSKSWVESYGSSKFWACLGQAQDIRVLGNKKFKRFPYGNITWCILFKS